MPYPDVPDYPGVPPLPRDPSVTLALPVPITGREALSFTSARQQIDSGDLDGIVTGDLDTALTAGDGFGSDAGDTNAGEGWGLYDEDGNLAINPTSFLGLENRNSTWISNYPLEEGAFESFNKVADPFDLVVGMACGGNLGERADFLARVKELAASLTLFRLVTPEETFDSVNIQRYDYARKTHNGASLIIVNLYLVEIRVNTGSEFFSEDDTAPTVEEAADATTASTSATQANAGLAANDVQNPASASPESQGQVQAQPATSEQAAAAPGTPAKLPAGYTQEEDTGLIIRPDGFVDEEWSIRVGAKELAK